MARDLRRAAGGNPDYPPVLLVYQGTPEEGAAFFETVWPDVRAVADPDRRLYRAFGLRRGGGRQFLSPGVVACGIRATLKGNFVGPVQGDARQMPGLFLVAGRAILWTHDFRHAGDHPDFATLPARFAPLLSASR